MDDIVERLRTVIATPHGVDIWTTTALEAADEIERLKTSRDRWREMALAYRLGTVEGDNLYEEMMGRG